MEYKYYLAQLDEKEAALYSLIYNKICTFTDSFEVEAPAETIQRVIKSIMLDNPELFWFEGKWKAVYKNESVLVVPRYKIGINAQNLDVCIENEIEAVLHACTGSIIDNIKCVYDWLLYSIQYGYSDNDQTVEGVFADKKAVCKGIAKAFQLLMNRLNIPSFLIEGTIDGSTSHVWNIVFVNECFYHVDVTMGYQKFRGLFYGLDRNKYYPCFLISDETMAVTHKIYCGQFPKCADDFNLDQFFMEKLKIPEKLRRYGMFRYLDKGSTGIVMESCETELPCVLKAVDAEGNKIKYRNACAELGKLKMLSNCNGIVKLIDSAVSESDGRVYMLLCCYKPLSVRRREADFDTVKDTVKLGIDVLNAMIECRDKGIYHLDIQPKNIYFDKMGKAVLGDFSEAVFDYELSRLKRGIGTLAFMAPEVYDKGIYGQASEIYSLGIIMYSLLNNAKLPFMEGNDLNTAIRLRLNGAELPTPYGCGGKLWKCIDKMCQFDLTKRFSTYEDAMEMLKSEYSRTNMND